MAVLWCLLSLETRCEQEHTVLYLKGDLFKSCKVTRWTMPNFKKHVVNNYFPLYGCHLGNLSTLLSTIDISNATNIQWQSQNWQLSGLEKNSFCDHNSQKRIRFSFLVWKFCLSLIFGEVLIAKKYSLIIDLIYKLLQRQKSRPPNFL